MIEKLTLYRAYCDKCGTRYNVASPRSSLVTHLRMMGWRVNKDTAIVRMKECDNVDNNLPTAKEAARIAMEKWNRRVAE